MNGLGFEATGAAVRLGGIAALRSVDLTIDAGEHVGIVGPSGAGKTTLLRLLGCAALADAGEVRVDGRPVGALSARELRALRARIGFVHQDLALVPTATAMFNVQTGRLGREGLVGGLARMLAPGAARRLEAFELLERVGVGPLAYRPVASLSGGEQQRVAVARALFQQPRALLADEPVASVDPARARAIVQLFKDVATERGATLVVSLHDVELARELFPRIVGLRRGAVALDSREAGHASLEETSLFELEGDAP